MTDPKPHPYNGRVTEGEPMPAYRQAVPPEPNDEDREAAVEMGRSPFYAAELRTVRTQAEWEAARRHEAERRDAK